jgi:hypothetical protein
VDDAHTAIVKRHALGSWRSENPVEVQIYFPLDKATPFVPYDPLTRKPGAQSHHFFLLPALLEATRSNVLVALPSYLGWRPR